MATNGKLPNLVLQLEGPNCVCLLYKQNKFNKRSEISYRSKWKRVFAMLDV